MVWKSSGGIMETKTLHWTITNGNHVSVKQISFSVLWTLITEAVKWNSLSQNSNDLSGQ